MCQNQKTDKICFTNDQFNAGTHICTTYNKEKECRKGISKYIEAGYPPEKILRENKYILMSEDGIADAIAIQRVFSKFMFKSFLIKAFLIIGFFLSSPMLYAQEEQQDIDLYELSMEQLGQIQITAASLVGTKLNKIPAAITIITREDIENTPARNLLDLIDVYSPGVLIKNHHAGPEVMKIRGMGERNYKTILLVNGRPVNQKGFYGSTVEITNWELNDIDRIEIIRGPGSVTYGPGAISGVINIIPKQAGSLDGFKTGIEYNERYDSKGAFLQFGFDEDKFKLFSHVSVRSTNGYDDPKYFQSLYNGEIGYQGTEVFSGSDGNPPQDLYRDYEKRPQIKAHLDLTYLDDWRFWARYTSSGQAIPTSDTKKQFESSSEWENHRYWRTESFLTAIENTHEFSDAFSLNSILSFDSENFIYAASGITDYSNTDIRQRGYSFAENEVFARSILNYKPSEKMKAAVGLEYSYDWLGDNWGEPGSFHGRAGKMNFFSENAPYNDIIDSSRVEEYNSGWSAQTYSLMGEFSYSFIPQLQVLASGRIDKNTYTDYMFSPRLALISEIDDKNTVKAIWQKSVRMNTMMELYYQNLKNLDPESEKLNTYQIIYNRLQNKNLSFQLLGYYNVTEVLGWSGTNVARIGDHESIGVELEARYKTVNDKWLFGINHSWFYLLDWKDNLKDSIGSGKQKVSLSDYYYENGFLVFTSTGNSLNFWADNITKFYARVKFFDNWTLHIDSRIIWEYTYGKDLIKMYDKAYDEIDISSLPPEDLAKYNENFAILSEYKSIFDEKDAFGLNWTLNASLSWDIPWFKKYDTILILYGQNIFTNSNNNRYGFGVDDLPEINWQEVPRAFGFRLLAKF